MPDAAVLQGLGVSAGSAAGPALRMGRVPTVPAPRPVEEPGHEIAMVRAALKVLADDLADRATRADGQGGAILQAQSLMAADPLISDAVETLIAGGLDAVHAVSAAFDEQASLLRESGGYFAERAADLEDLRNRVVAAILGVPMPGVPDPGHPYVLIADDLAPTDTVGLDPGVVLALVTARGGPTSHTAILARALGLPAVVALPAALAVDDGTMVHIDGDTGIVRVGVTDVQGSPPDRRRGPAPIGGPGRTADGHPVPLLLNIGSAADIRAEAEGVGLLRTELLFLGRREAPSIEEQRAAYAHILGAFNGRKVVIRTLDAGADKPLPFLGLAAEENPALGVRGLRTSRMLPTILDDQLTAITLAAAGTDADVQVMAPMVATAAEAADFAARARTHGITTVGAMVEVPAAALCATEILEHVDFLSIGTNDLAQYTMAADRQNGALADLLNPWQPAVLRLIASCAAAGRRAGKPVGVCGEAAADPALAVVLVGLGITSLSMSAAAIPAVRERLAHHAFQECAAIAEAVLAAADAEQARRLVP